MIVKICGIVHPDDAVHAACLGADYIGIIFSPISKRRVSVLEGKAIAHAAHTHCAQPVGIFVEESFEEIFSICKSTSIQVVQLHGDGARAQLSRLQEHFTVIYVHSVALDGSFTRSPELPSSVYSLYDTLKGGAGLPFDWKAFEPPSTPWILSGGLNPNNVSQAIRMLKPMGVDVAGGVQQRDSLRKDPSLVEAFIRSAKDEP